jgi:lysophospholipase L1-like esterase
MNRKILLGLSLSLNLILIPIGSVYLIRWAEVSRTRHVETKQGQQTFQSARARGDDFVSTLDYQWQERLFEEEPIQNGAIVFLGDSLTEAGNWQHVWRGRIPEPILNRGLVGDTMEGVIARLEEVTRHRPRKIFIMIGINDLSFEQKKPDDLVKQYVSLLHEINEKSPGSQAYLQSLLPVRGEQNTAVKAVNKRLSELADGKNVQYVDIHSRMTDSQGMLREDWTFDGVHIRAIAYQTWRDQVWPLVK